MIEKLLHAEELARLAGVHKSTVLLAIRRGELRASRTAGRSARIALEDARSYLRSRGRPVPPELDLRGGIPQVAVITESADVVNLARHALPGGVELLGAGEVYSALVAIGAHTPAAVVLDLDLRFMNPAVLIRALRAAPNLRGTRIVAVGLRDELFGAARTAGADGTVIKIDHRSLSEILQRFVTESVTAAAS